jgi:hypothetical protein
MFKSKLTEEDKQSILEWGKEGVRTRDIVERLQGKVTKQRVEQILSKNKIKNTAIWRKSKEDARAAQLEKLYGKAYLDKDSRKEAIYQIVRSKFRAKKANSLSSGWEWTVDFGEIEFPRLCPVLGIELDYWAESRQENSVSFDRIDSSKGYVSGNVVIMSWRANRIKNDGTAEEHKKIYEFMQKSLTSSS